MVKSIFNPEIQEVSFDLTGCYSISIITQKTKHIEIEAEVGGADKEDVVVTIEEDGNNLLVSTVFQPNYLERDTKFGALTFVSIELKVVVPENARVKMYGTSTNISAKGDYRLFLASLASGNCIFSGTAQNAQIKTQKGNVLLETNEGSIRANSVYGKVTTEKILEGVSVYELSTVEGNIEIQRTNL